LLATLISFSNEIAVICEATRDTDVQTVLHGVHLDQRLSPVVAGERVKPGILSYLWAGCGFGGSCLPKDVNALRAYARERIVDVPLLDAVMTVNAQRPRSLVDLAEKALGSLRGATITVLGLAFKPETSDLRNSPALQVIQAFQERGAIIRAYDPIVTAEPDLAFPGLSSERHEQLLGLSGGVTLCATKEAALRDSGAAVLVTACPEFLSWNWEELCSIMRQPLVIDGRGALSDVAWPVDVRYLEIGRAPNPAFLSRALAG